MHHRRRADLSSRIRNISKPSKSYGCNGIKGIQCSRPSTRGLHPGGASMSFHPSSPVLVEFSTEYLTPSGPTSSPF